MSGFDSFVESTPVERNDYSAALRVALNAFKTDPALKGYVITPADLKRESDYHAGGAFKAMLKTLNATTHKSAYNVVKGKIDDTAVIAIVKR